MKISIRNGEESFEVNTTENGTILSSINFILENYLSCQEYQTIVAEYIIKNHGYNTGIAVSDLLDRMIMERKNDKEVIQLPTRPRGRNSESNH